MHLDPNILALATVTCGIGDLMTVAGLGKGALELRPTHPGTRLQRL